jgi:hypothetical protein
LGRVCPGQLDLRMYRRNISRPGSQRHVQCTGDKEKTGERWLLSCLILPSVRRSYILQGCDVVAKADRGSGGSARCLHVRELVFSPPKRNIGIGMRKGTVHSEKTSCCEPAKRVRKVRTFLFTLASCLCLDLNHCGEAGVTRSDFSEWLRGRGQKLVFIIIFFLKED